MASPSLVRYLQALERTPPTTYNRYVWIPAEVLSEAGKGQKQADDRRIATRRRQWKENEQLEELAAESKAGRKTGGKKAKAVEGKEPAGIQKQGPPMHISPQQKPTANSKTTKEGTKRQKATKSKEQTGVQKQRTLIQTWRQQKPTSKSRTMEDDEDEEQRKPAKRQRIL